MTDKHGPRVDEALRREVASLTEGSPVEARAAEGRRQEDMPDDLPHGTRRYENVQDVWDAAVR